MSSTLTLTQVALILGVSMAEVLRLVRAGALKCARNAGRYRKVFATETVLDYIRTTSNAGEL